MKEVSRKRSRLVLKLSAASLHQVYYCLKKVPDIIKLLGVTTPAKDAKIVKKRLRTNRSIITAEPKLRDAR